MTELPEIYDCSIEDIRSCKGFLAISLDVELMMI